MTRLAELDKNGVKNEILERLRDGRFTKRDDVVGMAASLDEAGNQAGADGAMEIADRMTH